MIRMIPTFILMASLTAAAFAITAEGASQAQGSNRHLDTMASDPFAAGYGAIAARPTAPGN
ncbi:MAG: hypothetical protein KDJ77_09665 [Rhodobiaceae bacterium]|nr:hypothetical protein [Rhodobiaceae bacterium]